MQVLTHWVSWTFPLYWQDWEDNHLSFTLSSVVHLDILGIIPSSFVDVHEENQQRVTVQGADPLLTLTDPLQQRGSWPLASNKLPETWDWVDILMPVFFARGSLLCFLHAFSPLCGHTAWTLMGPLMCHIYRFWCLGSYTFAEAAAPQVEQEPSCCYW